MDAGLQNELQVVLFHPRAVHSLYEQADCGRESATNYSIRSPYPTFHFLRERDILAAITSGYPQVTCGPQCDTTVTEFLSDTGE